MTNASAQDRSSMSNPKLQNQLSQLTFLTYLLNAVQSSNMV